MVMVDVQATQFTDLEQHMFSSILSLPEFSGQFPSLNEAITNPKSTPSPTIIPLEFHQLLTCILELAQKKISTLYGAYHGDNSI